MANSKWVTATAAACAIGFALPLAAPAQQATVAEFGRVQAETLVLRAKNAREDEAEKLRVRTGDSTSPTSDGGTSAVLPVVSRVSGRSSEAVAYLLYSSGGVVPARVGTKLHGGYVVSKVSANLVELKRGGEEFVLGFSVIPPRAPAARSLHAGSPVGSYGNP